MCLSSTKRIGCNINTGQELYPKFSEMAANNATGGQHGSMKKLEQGGKLSTPNASFRASFKNLPGVINGRFQF
jgi:hypothetical protein